MTIFLIISLVCAVIALVDAFRADTEDVRMLSKTIWYALIVILPMIGAAAWFVAGRPQGDNGRRAARGLDRSPVAMKPRKIKNDRQAAVDRLTSDIRPTSVGARAIPGAMTAGSPTSAGRLAVARSHESPLVVGDAYAPMPVEAYARPPQAQPVVSAPAPAPAPTPATVFQRPQAATATLVAEPPLGRPAPEPADELPAEPALDLLDGDDRDFGSPHPTAAEPETELTGRRAASDPSPVLVTETGVRINREAASLYVTPRRGVADDEEEDGDRW